MLLRPRRRLLSRRGRRSLYSGVDENRHFWDKDGGRAAAKAVVALGKTLVVLTIRLIEGQIEAGVAIAVIQNNRCDTFDLDREPQLSSRPIEFLG